MIRLAKGTFIVYGEEREPEVVTISEYSFKLFYDCTCLVEDMRKAVTSTFGQGFQHALPAWSEDCLTGLAHGYTGPHQLRIRALCAAILLDITFQELACGTVPQAPKAPPAKRTNGGARIVNPSAPPRKPAPVGQPFSA